MRLSSVYSLAVLTSCATAEDAYLWTIDHGAAKYANTQASSISPETASSIIARRRGLLNDGQLVDADASTLREVKQYGGYQVPIYSTTEDPSPAKLLIRISGFTGTVAQFPSLPDLWIEDATKNLAEDFKARSNVEGVCEYNLQVPMKEGVDLVYSYDPEGASCKSAQQLRMDPTMLALFSTVPTAQTVSKDLAKLMRTLSHLAVTAKLETTLLVLPPTSKLQKTKAARRAGPSEEPLDLELAASSAATATATSSASKPSQTGHKLPAIIPQCFQTQESCDNTTNVCSGHGKCYKAYNGCYKCKCNSTLVRINKDGTKKHVQWGGNACQKKDISTEFVLFASFGVLMAALVAGAIGALYTMGSQQLPSVLGAGVAGSNKK